MRQSYKRASLLQKEENIYRTEPRPLNANKISMIHEADRRSDNISKRCSFPELIFQPSRMFPGNPIYSTFGVSSLPYSQGWRGLQGTNVLAYRSHSRKGQVL
jgi:hypothetical protein